MSALVTPLESPVTDQLSRPMRALRISLTDRCNLRCTYCMPEAKYDWLPQDAYLSIEDILKLTKSFYRLGMTKLRLTGGEPLIRKDVVEIVRILRAHFPDLDLALTTNGTLLAPVAEDLKSAGLNRLTVSIDSVDPRRFQLLTRRDRLASVRAGIEAAHQAEFDSLKLNALLFDGIQEEAPKLLKLAADYGAELRFIEYMDVGGATQWSPKELINGASFRESLIADFGELQPMERAYGDTAKRFQLKTGQTVGFIESMTHPFCGTCDRSRITADGIWFHCLYAPSGFNLNPWLKLPVDRLESKLRGHWVQRDAQGARTRKETGRQGLLYPLEELRKQPHLEMHTRGG